LYCGFRPVSLYNKHSKSQDPIQRFPRFYKLLTPIPGKLQFQFHARFPLESDSI